MDNEQAAKMIRWLDEERRKDKKEIATLHERLNALQQELAAQTRRFQEVEAATAGIASLGPRFTKVEELIAQVRSEASRQIETIEQRRAESERDAEKARGVDRDATNKLLVELRKALDPLPGKLEQEIHVRKEEENRISRLVLELQQKVLEFGKQEDDRMRALAASEEGRKHENKRIAELQVEVGELRRRLDENRGRNEITEDLVRRNDGRITEVVAAETERRSQQIAWMEQQAVMSANRDRRWTEWEARFAALQAQAEEFGRRMEMYAEAYRSMRNLPEEVQVTIERLERRIAETGELQRLAEERLRQEYAAFLADDQKRWATHMLLRDEQWREHDRLEQKSADRLAALEEEIAEVQDSVRVIQDVDANRLTGLMTLVREWVTEQEQPFTRVK